MRRKRARRHERPAPTETGPRGRLTAVWVAALLSLLVAGQLLTADSVAVRDGAAVVLDGLWLLLLAGWALTAWLGLLAPRPVGWLAGPLVGLLAWQGLQLPLLAGQANPRWMLNYFWQGVAFACLWLLVRQLLDTPARLRACLVVLLATAAANSLLGFHQSYVSLPAQRAAYHALDESGKLAQLRQAGLEAPPGSAARYLFENRLQSNEPMGTFVLTNSLAGSLVPWTLLAVGMALLTLRRDPLRTTVAAGSAPARPLGAIQGRGSLICWIGLSALLGSCLLLTKSRAALLAVASGMALLLISEFRRPARPWRAVAMLAGGSLALAAAVFAAQRLDGQIVIEAFKSLRFRLQYWQASLEMLQDHRWLGVGWGNFQSLYPAYRSPQASETIADPHNFALEQATAGGLPGLLLLLALLAVWLLDLHRHSRPVAGGAHTSGPGVGGPGVSGPGVSGPSVSGPGSVTRSGHRDDSVWPVYVGGFAGCLLAWPLALLSNYPALDPTACLLTLPAIAVLAWLLRGWVRSGPIPLVALLAASLGLLLNLSAASGWSIPGVAGGWWFLLAATLNAAEFRAAEFRAAELWRARGEAAERTLTADSPPQAVRGSELVEGEPRSGRGITSSLLLGSCLLAIVFLKTTYWPVLLNQHLLAAARQERAQGRLEAAEDAYLRAADADPYSAEPWQGLADVRHQQWLRAPYMARRQRYREAVSQALAIDPGSLAFRRQLARWAVEAMPLGGTQLEQEALAAHQSVAERDPASGEAWARLARAAYLAGDRPRAAAAAARALELDHQNPHAERALAHLILAPVELPSGRRWEGGPAEPRLRDLRKGHQSPDSPVP